MSRTWILTLGMALCCALLLAAGTQAQGFLAIGDSTDDQIFALDPITGDFLRTFVGPDSPDATFVIDAIASVRGTVLAANRNSPAHILEYDFGGNLLGNFDNGINLKNLRGMDMGPDGYLYMACDLDGTTSNAVRRFDAATGAYVDDFIMGDDPNGLDMPFDIVFRPNGHLLVGDLDRDAILEYDTFGALIGVYTAPKLIFPEQIALLSNGNILVAEWSNDLLIEFDNAGNFVREISNPLFDSVRGVCELPSGNWLVSGNTGVHEVDTTGALVRTIIGDDPNISGQFIGLVVPEPFATSLFALGAFGLLAVRRRTRK